LVRRLWIIQEVVKAEKAVLISGRERLSWQTFQIAISALSGHQLDDLISSPVALQSFHNLKTIIIAKKSRQNGIPSSLMRLVLNAHGFNCTDDRDRVFALLGLANDVEGRIRPDYSQSTDYSKILTELARWQIFENKNLSSFSCTYKPTPICQSIRPKVPSWVPDVTRLDIQELFTATSSYGTTVPFNACGNSHVQARPHEDTTAINIIGTPIDTIATLSLPPDELLDQPRSPSVKSALSLALLPGLEGHSWHRIARYWAWLDECNSIALNARREYQSLPKYVLAIFCCCP
jgi:hypothetical protein